jgi:hypothetical protein
MCATECIAPLVFSRIYQQRAERRNIYGERFPVHYMKYLLVALLLASIAGVEFFHELASDDAPGAKACMAPEGKAAAIRDVLLAHLRNH